MNKQLVVVNKPIKLNVRPTKKGQNKNKQKRNTNNIFDIVEIPRAKSYKVKNKSNKSMRTNSKGNFVIRHREFIQNVSSPVTGNSNQDLCAFKLIYAAHVNPGNKKLFPWLNAMSYNYECYKFKNLKFIYKPICNTDTTGTVFIAMDYDPDDALYESKVQMLSAKDAVSGQPWTPIIHTPKRNDYNKEKTYYISHRIFEDVPKNSVKLLDVGTIQVGVESCKGNQLLGELYIDYEIELITPELNVHEILNSVQLSSSQNKSIASNNSSILGTITENKNLLLKMVKSGLALAKGIAGNKGDILYDLFKRERNVLVNILSTGSTRPTIKSSVFQQALSSNQEINNDQMLSLGYTELIEEVIDGDYSNVTESSDEIVTLMNHEVLTASQVYQIAVKLPAGALLNIYPDGEFGIDYSLFNIQDISGTAFDELKEVFGA